MSTFTNYHSLLKPELTDPADITAMNSNWDTIDSELSNLRHDIKTNSIQTVLATSTDGISYTANVDNVDSLYVGLAIFFVPSMSSKGTNITLNINGLGAKSIRRKLSMGSGSTVVGVLPAWFYIAIPSLLVYDGGNWIAEDFTKPCATDLYGTVPVSHGGTGASDIAEARANLGIIPENIGAVKKSGDTLDGNLSTNSNLAELREFRVKTPNGDVSLCVENGRGLYDYTQDKWVVTAKKGSSDWIFNGKAQGIVGTLDFGKTMDGLQWETADGTKFHIRPYTAGNLFQITRRPPGGSDMNAFSIDKDGNIDFGGRPISINRGGTGASTAADARTALDVYSKAEVEALIAKAVAN